MHTYQFEHVLAFGALMFAIGWFFGRRWYGQCLYRGHERDESRR